MREVFENNVFWLIDASGRKEGPYCPNNKCMHDNDHKRQRMLDNGDGSNSCPQCNQHVIVDRAKWDAHGEALARENEQRAEEINRRFNF